MDDSEEVKELIERLEELQCELDVATTVASATALREQIDALSVQINELISLD